MQLKTTIAVKVADIPLYLRDSAFYKSLYEDCDDDDNDGDNSIDIDDDLDRSNCDKQSLYKKSLLDDDKLIYIPQDVLRDSTTIASLEDFDHLLRTIRFWVIDIIPMTIFHFSLSYDHLVDDALKDVIAEYEKDLPYLTVIMKVRSEPNYHNKMLLICRSNCVELMEYLYLHTMSSQSSRMMMTMMLWSRDVFATAAYYGSFECLQFAFTHGCVVWDTLTCSNAALQGTFKSIFHHHHHYLSIHLLYISIYPSTLSIFLSISIYLSIYLYLSYLSILPIRSSRLPSVRA